MTLANPRNIIGAYAPEKSTSYFGLPGRVSANYETDPGKIYDTTTLGGALGGLAAAAGNGIRNMAGRAYNAVAATGATTPSQDEQLTAGFAARNEARYATPGATPSAGIRPAPQMLPAHTPGAIVAPSATPVAVSAPSVAPRVAGRGVRRAAAVAPALPAWSQAPAEDQVQPDATPVEAAPETPQAQPMISELPVQGAEFDAKNAGIPGANGGFGLTRNADGTVDQMFALRARTPQEDAASPPVATSAPVAAGIRLRPGDLGYTGSQQQWEDQQAVSQMMSNPFPFKTAAAMLAQRQQAETEANNMRTFGLNAAQTAANVQHLGTEDWKTTALLPGEVGTQYAGIRRSDAAANKDVAETQEVAPTAAADRQYKADLGYGVRSGAAIAQYKAPYEAANLLSETEFRTKSGEALQTKAEALAERNAQADYNNAQKAMDAYLAAHPDDIAGAQNAYNSSIEAARQSRSGATPVVTPAVPAKKGFFGIGRKAAQPSTITWLPKGTAAPPAGYVPTGKTIGGKAAYTGPDGKIYTF